MTDLLIYMTGYVLAGLVYLVMADVFVILHMFRVFDYDKEKVEQFAIGTGCSIKSMLDRPKDGGLFTRILFAFIIWPITITKNALELLDDVDEYVECTL